MEKQILYRLIKRVSSGLVGGAIALWLWQLLGSLPTALEPLALFTQIVLLIHGLEGLVAAALVGRFRMQQPAQLGGETSQSDSAAVLLAHLPQNLFLAMVKAGLYTLFVGTVGLVEILSATGFVGSHEVV